MAKDKIVYKGIGYTFGASLLLSVFFPMLGMSFCIVSYYLVCLAKEDSSLSDKQYLKILAYENQLNHLEREVQELTRQINSSRTS